MTGKRDEPDAALVFRMESVQMEIFFQHIGQNFFESKEPAREKNRMVCEKQDKIDIRQSLKNFKMI